MDQSGPRNLYGYPDMGRTGLGHSLLAWARCVVWCRQTGATMLAPRWLRLRVGPYLRRERDKRAYFLLFHKGGDVGPLRRTWLLATADRLYAELDLPDASFRPNRPTVVVFRNAMAGNEHKFFPFVVGHGALLREKLVAMTRRRHLPAPPSEPFIAIHVRMGDFRVVSVDDLRQGATNAQTPVAWYVNVLERVRRQVGATLPVVVFSDGSDEALAPLLAQPGVRRAAKASAVTDMLSISQSRLLIGSRSGFSLWGAFLGDVPRILHSGREVTAPGEAADRVFTNDGIEDLSPECVEVLRRALAPADR